MQLGRLDTALAIAGEADSESKWKQLGELAMSSGKLDVRPDPPKYAHHHRVASTDAVIFACLNDTAPSMGRHAAGRFVS